MIETDNNPKTLLDTIVNKLQNYNKQMKEHFFNKKEIDEIIFVIEEKGKNGEIIKKVEKHIVGKCIDGKNGHKCTRECSKSTVIDGDSSNIVHYQCTLDEIYDMANTLGKHLEKHNMTEPKISTNNYEPVPSASSKQNQVNINTNPRTNTYTNASTRTKSTPTSYNISKPSEPISDNIDSDSEISDKHNGIRIATETSGTSETSDDSINMQNINTDSLSDTSDDSANQVQAPHTNHSFKPKTKSVKFNRLDTETSDYVPDNYNHHNDSSTSSENMDLIDQLNNHVKNNYYPNTTDNVKKITGGSSKKLRTTTKYGPPNKSTGGANKIDEIINAAFSSISSTSKESDTNIPSDMLKNITTESNNSYGGDTTDTEDTSDTDSDNDSDKISPSDMRRIMSRMYNSPNEYSSYNDTGDDSDNYNKRGDIEQVSDADLYSEHWPNRNNMKNKNVIRIDSEESEIFNMKSDGVKRSNKYN
jgi:hypothetical protein